MDYYAYKCVVKLISLIIAKSNNNLYKVLYTNDNAGIQSCIIRRLKRIFYTRTAYGYAHLGMGSSAMHVPVMSCQGTVRSHDSHTGTGYDV